MSGWWRLVRSELLKLRSTRLWWGLLIGVVVMTAVQAGVTAGFAGVDLGAGQGTSPGLDEPETIRSVYASAAFAGAYIFALVLGITGMTGEYRYQTATPTFLASPRRTSTSQFTTASSRSAAVARPRSAGKARATRSTSGSTARSAAASRFPTWPMASASRRT